VIDKYESQAAALHELTRAASTAKKRAPQHASRIVEILGKIGIAQASTQEVSPK
jgi:hypothetical protein